MSVSGTVCHLTSKPAGTRKPYIIDAIIGNGKMLGALTEDGELHRLWWPQIGFPNHINEFVFGVFVEDVSFDITWLNSGKWTHHQFYTTDTNVLVTRSTCHALPITFEVADFCLPDSDTVVRIVDITSVTGSKLTVHLYVSASFAIAESSRYNAVAFNRKNDCLVYWRHEYAFAVGSDRECTGFEAGKRREMITTKSKSTTSLDGQSPLDGHEIPKQPSIMLNGHDMAIDMSGALSWTIIFSSESQTVQIPVYISAGDSIDAALSELESAKAIDATSHLDLTINYWNEFLQASRPLKTSNEEIKKLFKRSVLTFKLLSDKTHGALLAAPEFDEDYSRCGGYAFCWGRDAAYITTAIDKCGYPDQVSRFYEWTLKAQSPDGSWQQRHFMDGRLAPQWGLQIDETGSIVWGMWEHYLVLVSREEEAQNFADKVWNAVKKAAEFLETFVDPETKLPLSSRDLWEERAGEHIYSSAAVFAGLKAASEFAKLHSRSNECNSWLKAAESIRDGILINGWSEERGHFLRVIKLQVDKATYTQAKEKSARVFTTMMEKGYVRYHVWVEGVLDISLLGLCIPFDVVKADDRRMELTAEEIRRKLTATKVGGLRRYEEDHYLGGNPWILTTLWMAQYDARRGNFKLATEALQWAMDHQTKTGLLPEQVDQETGKTAWVVPLTWSHAMYVLTVIELDDLGAI